MAGKKKQQSAKARAIEIEKTDAERRPCIIPEVHTDVCDCYGVKINRNPQETK